MKIHYYLKTAIFILCFTLLLFDSTTLKAQSTNYRLIKQDVEFFSNQSQAFEKASTLQFVYSNGRGSDLKNNIINYDTAYIYDTISQNPIQRVSNKFDSNANIIMNTSEKYDDFTAKWLNTSRVIRTYDGNNNLQSTTAQNWSVAFSKWLNTERTTYTYNSGNALDSEITQRWIDSTTSWKSLYKFSYNYGSLHLLSKIQSVWRSGSWEDAFRTTFSYDNAGRIKKENFENKQSNSWTNSSYKEYTYATSSSSWLNQTEFFRWDNSKSSWYKSGLNSYSHNTGDYDYSSNILQQRDTAQNSWENESKIENTFTTFNRYHHQTYYRWSSGIWEKINRSVFSYEAYNLTGISESIEKQIKTTVYPNPAINMVYFQFENPTKGERVQLRVFNSIGQLISQKTFDTQSTESKIHWNPIVHNAKSGIYYYQIISGEYQSNGQFIVH